MLIFCPFRFPTITPVLRIQVILMRIRILDPHWKKWIQVLSLKFTEFLKQSKIFKFFVLFFSLIFMLKLDEPFRNQEIFIISFFNSSDFGFESKFFLLQFLVDILPLGSGCAYFCGSGSRKRKSCGSNGSGS